MEVVVGGRQRDVAGRRERHLLALLASEAGRPVGVGRIIDLLWGTAPPRTVDKSLQTHVSRVRTMLDLDLDVLARRGRTYVLDLPAEAVDGLAFRTELASGTDALAAGDAAAAADVLGRALARWRADEPAGLGDTDAAAAWRRRWVEARLQAVEAWARARVTTGRLDGLAGELEAVLARHPDRDGLWLALMATHDAAGERTVAIEAYHRARRHHADELGLDPSPALEDAYERLLSRDPPGAAAPRAPAGAGVGDRPGPAARVARPELDRLADRVPSPPALAALVGRDADAATVTAALVDGRLVTITGTGGVGKTALAAVVAGNGPGPVAWADLVVRPVDSSIARAVLTAIGGRSGPEDDPLTTAQRLVGATDLLLVLDNCEHVLDDARATVARLVRHCPRLRVLATSRQPLGLAGEHVVALAPLASGAHGPAASLLQRAVARRGGTLDDVDPERVAVLCERLDGLPLALELAAPLVERLGVEAVTSGLDDRFGLLDVAWDATGRRRDLAGTVAWSEALLSPRLRTLLRRLGVFTGPFDADMVVQVCAEPDTTPAETERDVSALADRGLVESLGGTPSRFRQLETVRAHARRALGGRGLARMRARHATWVAGLADRVAADYLSAAEPAMAMLVDDTLDEILAAHDWAMDGGDADVALRIAAGVAQPMWWGVRGDLAAVVEGTLETFGGQPHPLASEVWAHGALWRLHLDDRAAAIAALAHAVVAAEAVGQPLPVTWWRCDVELRGRAYDLAGARDALERARDTGLDAVGLGLVEAGIVPFEAYRGELARAATRSRRLHRMASDLGSPGLLAWAEAGLSATPGLSPDESLATLRSAVEHARAARNWLAESIILMLIAAQAGRVGDDVAAARGLAALLGQWGRRGSWRYEWNTVREAMVVMARHDRHEELLVLLAAGEVSDAAPGLLGEQRRQLVDAGDEAARVLGPEPTARARERGRGLGDADAAWLAREVLLDLVDTTFP
nr:BTAD domain-containing putative transcriptional regulator [Salsipaludibacter albus]